MSKSQAITGVGLGLRWEFIDELLAERPRFDHVLGLKGSPPAEHLAAALGQEVRWA